MFFHALLLQATTKKKENAKCSGDISFHVHAAYFHFNVPLLRENHQSLHGSIFHTEEEHTQTLACLKKRKKKKELLKHV